MRDTVKEILKIFFIESFRALVIVLSFIVSLITLEFLLFFFNKQNYGSRKESYRQKKESR
jgi:hypothetical protein